VGIFRQKKEGNVGYRYEQRRKPEIGILGNLGRPQRSNVNRIVNHSVVEHPLPY
jgi:hypothetical protein